MVAVPSGDGGQGSQEGEEEDRENSMSNKTLKQIEEEVILKRLHEFNGNRTRTAKSLDVSVRWIQKKIKEYENRSQ